MELKWVKLKTLLSTNVCHRTSAFSRLTAETLQWCLHVILLLFTLNVISNLQLMWSVTKPLNYSQSTQQIYLQTDTDSWHISINKTVLKISGFKETVLTSLLHFDSFNFIAKGLNWLLFLCCYELLWVCLFLCCVGQYISPPYKGRAAKKSQKSQKSEICTSDMMLTKMMNC